MKKLFSLIILTVFVGLLVSSCSEDSTNEPNPTPNPSGNEYFPKTDGSYWVYDNYDLDDNGNKDEGTAFIAKHIITGTKELGEKEGIQMEIQDMNGNKIEGNEYFYVTDNQISQYFQLLPELEFSLPVDIPEDWYKIYDTDANEWILHEEKLENVEFEYGGATILLNDDFVIKATNVGTEEITWGENLENSSTARVFKLEYEYGGTASFGGFPVQIPFTVTVLQYYVKDIGLAKTVFEPLTISVLGQEAFKMNGSIMLLQDYSVAE